MELIQIDTIKWVSTSYINTQLYSLPAAVFVDAETGVEMNHSNSEFEGIFRGPDRHGFPIHTDFSLIREINTGEHVHQRSLSTTILS